MRPTRPATPRTVGDVLRRPVSVRSISSAPLLSPRHVSDERFTFLTEADVHSTPHPTSPPPSKTRLQSVFGARRSADVQTDTKILQATAAQCTSEPPLAARHHTHADQHTRRPVDEALFCAVRMESENAVASQLRQLGPERLTRDFRSLCSRLSMHHVTSAQFTFLCAAVLNAPVSQRDCEVVFAFLRAEEGVGSLDAVDLLSRLRTLFVSPDVLCALQLKRMLETNALSECTVSLDELQKAYVGVQSLLESGAMKDELELQWHTLHSELCRIHVQFAVLVTTFRTAARRLAPTLCTVLDFLSWDGTWGDHQQVTDTLSSPCCSVSSSSALQWAAVSAPTLHALPTLPSVEPAESHAALLFTVTELYRRRLAAQALAAGQLNGGFGAAARRAARRPTCRASSSAVDATNPHFLADAYATGRVICTHE
jgi:hypothetical protein